MTKVWKTTFLKGICNEILTHNRRTWIYYILSKTFKKPFWNVRQNHFCYMLRYVNSMLLSTQPISFFPPKRCVSHVKAIKKRKSENSLRVLIRDAKSKMLGSSRPPFGSFPLKRVLHPNQFCDCSCIFLNNYITLATSKICFL